MLTDIFGITRKDFVTVMWAFVAFFVILEVFIIPRQFGKNRVLSFLGIIIAILAAFYLSQ